ncbi:hypothetical protein PUN28_007353 [Cardiocondyla obscurior]|uniref:Uncharacterized protein n=1 Tax=Cardiocondyla obscurior TaxID=286306 RepID=A0AAW2G7T2_9HYME
METTTTTTAEKKTNEDDNDKVDDDDNDKENGDNDNSETSEVSLVPRDRFAAEADSPSSHVWHTIIVNRREEKKNKIK